MNYQTFQTNCTHEISAVFFSLEWEEETMQKSLTVAIKETALPKGAWLCERCKRGTGLLGDM